MTTALSQIQDASPPTLPGSTVLRCDLSEEPAVLMHDLGSAQGTLYCRFMVNPSQAGAGEVTIAGGIGSDDVGIWRVAVDLDTSQFLLVIGESEAAADFSTELDWHTVEVELDPVAGSAALRIDGIERGTINTGLNATRYVWLGCAFSDSAVIGSIDLDQWVLATSPIGVPLSEPTADHGADPRRWLVVYNRTDADSAGWADAYRSRRGVPYSNLCGLDLSMNETISAADFESMRQQISDYLQDNALDGQIVGILLGLNVPGYADVADLGSLTPIASYLHTNDTHGLPTVNPMYQDEVATRPNTAGYTGVRLTGRVDAASLADALALLDRADAINSQALAHDGLADVVIDINPDNPDIGPTNTEPVEAWANSLGIDRLRLPKIVYDQTLPTAVSGESCVWGWRDASPSSNFFSQPAGRRALCIQLHPEPVPATSARNTAGSDWMSTALTAGYAAAGSPSRAYTPTSVPLPPQLFEALRLGWTFAEAWMVAQPFLRDGLQVVGDPLMTIGFPKAGYDVFGPVDRVDQIDLSEPKAILHAGQKSFDLDPADAPLLGGASRYVVQRLDDAGRSDRASAAVYAGIAQGQIVRPALPAWPAHDGWGVLERQGGLVLCACWPISACSVGVESLQLFAQSGSDDPVLVSQEVPKAGQNKVCFEVARATDISRYRFRIVQGPATYDTPWSKSVPPINEAVQPIVILEGTS